MKRAVVFVFLGGLSLTGAVLSGLHQSPAQAAELNGFAINTQDKDKAVTITLFTDQRVPYATEHQGKQFTIVLPNTQVSPEQLKNGLPVVVDNKNHFIGRAVPTEDGKVRIILPNLPASEYAVSIQQKHATVVKATGDSAAKPRPAVNLNTSNQFEQVVANIPKAMANHHVAPKSTADNSNMLRISPTVHHVIERGPNTRNMIWNPYATKAPSRPVVAHEAPPANKPMPIAAEPIHLNHVAPQAIEESRLPQPTAQAMPTKDALWYLHSLPPANPNALPTADLKTLAAQDAIPAVTPKAPAAPEVKKAELPQRGQYTRGLVRELRDGFKSLPQWLLITLAVFMGGVGIFTLVGGLVLLKILFVQARTQGMTQPLEGLSPETLAKIAAATATENQPDAGKGNYATRPGHVRTHRYDFEDKSSVSALDYLKGSPDSVTTAVHNTTLLRFPTQRRHRSGVKKPVAHPKSAVPTYGISP